MSLIENSDINFPFFYYVNYMNEVAVDSYFVNLIWLPVRGLRIKFKN